MVSSHYNYYYIYMYNVHVSVFFVEMLPKQLFINRPHTLG